MTIQELLDIFVSEMEDTDPKEFTKESLFKEIPGFDSLVALSVISCVDDVTDVLLSGDDMLAANTIEDLHNTILSRL